MFVKTCVKYEFDIMLELSSIHFYFSCLYPDYKACETPFDDDMGPLNSCSV